MIPASAWFFKQNIIVLKKLGSLIGLAVFVIGLSGIPDDLAAWHKWIMALQPMLTHEIARWAFCIVGFLTVAVLNIPWKRLLPPQTHDGHGEPKPSKLWVEFDVNKHVTRRQIGGTQVRITVRNSGPQRIRISSVMLDSIVPLINIPLAAEYTTQFHAVPLKLVRASIGSPLDCGGAVEALLVHSEKNDDWFYFNSAESDYRVPSGSVYELEIVATGRTGLPARRKFKLRQTNGEIDISPIDTPVPN